MIAREAVLGDDKVRALLSERFVPLAIDNVANPNMTAAEKAFLADKGGKASTHGMGVFTASGKFLARGGGFQAEPNLKMLEKALVEFDPASEPGNVTRLDGESDLPQPPKDGAIAYVTWGAAGDWHAENSKTSADGKYNPEFRQAVGADRLWVSREEKELLAKSSFAPALSKRIGSHLSYVMAGKVTALKLSIIDGKITGQFTTDQDTGGVLTGSVTFTKNKLKEFRLIAKGEAARVNDCGFAVALTVAPAGKMVPMAMLFELADPADSLAKVLPHRSRNGDFLNR